MYQTHSEEETKEVARHFALALQGGEVVFLRGDLGTGKTTFVRGVAEAFGYHNPVRSPTFTITNRYAVECGTVKHILHVDLYRIEDAEAMLPLALEEEAGRADTIVFVEWPERDEEHILAHTHEIEFTHKDDIHNINIK